MLTPQSPPFHVIEVDNAAPWPAFFAFAAAPLEPAKVAQAGADCHLVATLSTSGMEEAAGDVFVTDTFETDGPDASAVRARCSLWWVRVPQLANERVGCIGHFAASDVDAGIALLNAACRRLSQAGCTLAVGPLDGSTFRAYRFVVQSTDSAGAAHPPFFLEPQNPPHWPDAFRRAGFTELARYVSARTDLDNGVLQNAQKRMAQDTGALRVRPIDLNAFDRELDRIYDLVMQAFRPNLLFAPISRSEFAAEYAPLRHVLQPDLVLLAEEGTRLAGFILALPDLAQSQRGEPMTMAIFKTLAVHPDIAGAGMGSVLAAHAHLAAYRLGYRHVIHALMNEDNRSRRISARYAAPMRRYALFQRRLV